MNWKTLQGHLIKLKLYALVLVKCQGLRNLEGYDFELKIRGLGPRLG